MSSVVEVDGGSLEVDDAAERRRRNREVPEGPRQVPGRTHGNFRKRDADDDVDDKVPGGKLRENVGHLLQIELSKLCQMARWQRAAALALLLGYF